VENARKDNPGGTFRVLLGLGVMERGRDVKRVGLARALSKLGYCSRSQATELICAGRVRLNGANTRDPETPVFVDRDRIEVDHRIRRRRGENILDAE